jgi:hypothetical protein
METRALGGIEHGLNSARDAGLLGEASQPTLRKGVQGVADSLDATADVLGNLGGRVLLRARE